MEGGVALKKQLFCKNLFELTFSSAILRANVPTTSLGPGVAMTNTDILG